MKITLYNCQTKLKISKRAIASQVKALMQYLEVFPDEIIIHFVGKRRIAHLHGQFFQDPTVTDCISFPIDRERTDSYFLLGEIFVCPEVALAYAQKHQIDAYEELSLYVVHGILHLLGYNDLHPSERSAMKKKEKKCMEFLKSKDLF